MRAYVELSCNFFIEVFNPSANSTLKFIQGQVDYHKTTLFGDLDIKDDVRTVEEMLKEPAVNAAKNTAQTVKNSTSTLQKVGQMVKLAAKVTGKRMTTFILIPTAILDPGAIRPKIEM